MPALTQRYNLGLGAESVRVHSADVRAVQHVDPQRAWQRLRFADGANDAAQSDMNSDAIAAHAIYLPPEGRNIAIRANSTGAGAVTVDIILYPPSDAAFDGSPGVGAGWMECDGVVLTTAAAETMDQIGVDAAGVRAVAREPSPG